jgi:ATP-dependent helicase/nuclease subunit A
VRQRFGEPAWVTSCRLRSTSDRRRSCASGPTACSRRAFPRRPNQHAPRFAPLDPDPGKTLAGGVLTLTHACDKEFLQTEDARKIAAYIRSEIDAGRRHFSDFLILTRKKAGIAVYADALEALNIAVEVSGAGAFGESREVQALTLLLRALADPQDPVALIAVLRGPLFGISDSDLFAFKQAGGWFNLFHESDPPRPPGESVEAALTARPKSRW